MTFNSKIEQTVVSLIVQEYQKKSQEIENGNSAFVSDMSISFRKLFYSLPGRYSFGKRTSSLCYCINLDLKGLSGIKDIKERARARNNFCLPFQIELLQAILFLKQLEDNNLIIVINNFSNDALHNFDDEEGYFIFVNDRKIEKYIKYFLYSDIIPTSSLIDIYKNEFKTEDERRYKRQVFISWIAIFVSALIGLSSIIISICNDTKMDKKQYNEIIDEMKHINKNIFGILYGKTENAEP